MKKYYNISSENCHFYSREISQYIARTCLHNDNLDESMYQPLTVALAALASIKCPKMYNGCQMSDHCPLGYVSTIISEVFSCESQYRCLQSRICLPEKYICDWYPQCPLEDDEKLCNLRSLLFFLVRKHAHAMFCNFSRL